MAAKHLDIDAFPTLDERQMASLAKCELASLHQFHDGERIFETGDRDLSFFVVKQGQIEIVDESGDVPNIIKILGRGEFTGDVSQLTGGPSLVSGIARVHAKPLRCRPTHCATCLITTRSSPISFCKRSWRDGSFCGSREASSVCV